MSTLPWIRKGTTGGRFPLVKRTKLKFYQMPCLTFVPFYIPANWLPQQFLLSPLSAALYCWSNNQPYISVSNQSLYLFLFSLNGSPKTFVSNLFLIKILFFFPKLFALKFVRIPKTWGFPQSQPLHIKSTLKMNVSN